MSVITISLGSETIDIDKEKFTALFDNSVVHDLKMYTNILRNGYTSFSEFVELARKADIPYALFFAPKSFVAAQIKRKTDLLLQGVTKNTFSMNTRGSVQLRDIELIVKDLLRKQELVKKHMPKTPTNTILGCLKSSKLSDAQQANKLRDLIGIDLNFIKKLNKTKTFEYIMSQLEKQNVFISQSSRTFMPQIIQKGVAFSGMCIKDKKFPFIFFNNKDESSSFEPEGRKVLTLVLLMVCLARSKFSPISYNEQSTNLIQDKEFCLAEEILMPKRKILTLRISDIKDVKTHSDTFSVTPSALLMRLKRLRRISGEDALHYSKVLQDEFNVLPVPQARTPKAVNGFRKYTGTAYPNALFRLMDSGKVTRSEVCRVLFFNKKKQSFIGEFRKSL